MARIRFTITATIEVDLRDRQYEGLSGLDRRLPTVEAIAGYEQLLLDEGYNDINTLMGFMQDAEDLELLCKAEPPEPVEEPKPYHPIQNVELPDFDEPLGANDPQEQ